MSARMTIAALAMLAAIACCGCGHPRPATSINERAALTGSLPWNPLQWMVITSLMDNGAATMSTLYGNEIAVQAARSGSRAYPAGAVLALVTWTKQNDEHWFGAKIPASAKSVEFVSVSHGLDHQPAYSYQSYQGSPLTKASASEGNSAGSRAAYLVSLRAAVLP
jgi:hypothetical protein